MRIYGDPKHCTKLLKVSKVFHIIFRLNQPNCKERIFIDKDDSGQINSKN